MFANNHKNGSTHDYEWQTALGGIALGLFVGAAAGAITMLFVAPYSGRKTRSLVRHKALELRDKATDLAEDARDQANETLRQARSKTKQITRDARNTARSTARDLQQRGKDVVDKQRERVESALGAGQKAIADAINR
jgi:gas vesicle protein